MSDEKMESETSDSMNMDSKSIESAPETNKETDREISCDEKSTGPDEIAQKKTEFTDFLKKKCLQIKNHFLQSGKIYPGLLICIIFAVLLRVDIKFCVPLPETLPDTSSYAANAKWFRAKMHNPFKKVDINPVEKNFMLMRAPVYSIFMAVAQSDNDLTFPLERKPENKWIVRLYNMQLFLGVLTTIAFFLIGYHLCQSQVIGFITSLAYTGMWQHLNLETVLLTEGVSFFFASYTLLFALLMLKNREKKYAVIGGLLAALSVMTRPVLISMLPGIVFALLLLKDKWRIRGILFLLFIISYILPSQIYSARNKIIGDYWGVTCALPYNLAGWLGTEFEKITAKTEDEQKVLKWYIDKSVQEKRHYGLAWSPGPVELFESGMTVGKFSKALQSLCKRALFRYEMMNQCRSDFYKIFEEEWNSMGSYGVLNKEPVPNSYINIFPQAMLFRVTDWIFLTRGVRTFDLLYALIVFSIISWALNYKCSWKYGMILIMFCFIITASLLVFIDYKMEVDRHFMGIQPFIILALTVLFCDIVRKIIIAIIRLNEKDPEATSVIKE